MSTLTVDRESVLGPESAGVLMTPEEFDAIEEYNEEYRYELVNGVLVVSPIPLPEETGPNDLLGYWLLDYRERNREGSALDYTLPQQYVYLRRSRRIADRLIWTGLGRLPHRQRDVPTIAVEFVSAGRRSWKRDYIDKRREYRKAGIREYWIIDRFQRTLTVIHNEPTGEREQVFTEKQAYRPALLPGFRLPLGRLLAAADRLAELE